MRNWSANGHQQTLALGIDHQVSRDVNDLNTPIRQGLVGAMVSQTHLAYLIRSALDVDASSTTGQGALQAHEQIPVMGAHSRVLLRLILDLLSKFTLQAESLLDLGVIALVRVLPDLLAKCVNLRKVESNLESSSMKYLDTLTLVMPRYSTTFSDT